MAKPAFLSGYSKEVSASCEQVLVTLLHGLGPWRESVYLVGGLTPRYLVKGRPPTPHAGTGDVDIVVDLAMLADTQAYRTLEENLKRLKFERSTNAKGTYVSWRWQRKVGNAVLILEFLADDPERKGRTRMTSFTALNIMMTGDRNPRPSCLHHASIQSTPPRCRRLWKS